MYTVLLDFNGTLFFDSCFHVEAWSKIYREFHRDAVDVPDTSFFCGPRNEDIIRAIAPNLSKKENEQCSVHKEALYRDICREHPTQLHLAAGAEEFLQYLQDEKIPYALASASIKDNIDFYFETFHLDRWLKKEQCVYDDGTYANKGEMHIEAAKRLGVSISDCIVIEDSIGAITYARQNGAGKIIAVGSKVVQPDLIRAGADHCICDFTEFNCQWLKN